MINLTNIQIPKLEKKTLLLVSVLSAVVLALASFRVFTKPKTTSVLPELASVSQIIPGTTKETQLQKISDRYAEKKF